MSERGFTLPARAPDPRPAVAIILAIVPFIGGIYALFIW